MSTPHFRSPPQGVPATADAGIYVINPTQRYGEYPGRRNPRHGKRNNIAISKSQSLSWRRGFPTPPYQPPSLARRLVRWLLRLGRSVA